MEKSKTKSKTKIDESLYKKLLTNKLEQLGVGGIFVWLICLQCATTPIFDGFHLSSYTFLSVMPEDQWCGVTALQSTNWTVEQQKLITETDLQSKGCQIRDWNYELLGSMNFEDAFEFTQKNSNPVTVSCKAHGNYQYADKKASFVSEWDLVCDKSTDRTMAQIIISLGKLIGSLLFGVIADKYGRRLAILYGSIIFVIAGFICTYSPWYMLFLVGRFLLGFGSTGFYSPALTIIVENTSLQHRTWMSIAFACSYPLGLLLLTAFAYLLRTWRDLSLALTLPSILLILDAYFMNESPRWLIKKARYGQAYKDLFKQDSPYEVIVSEKKVNEKKETSAWNEMRILFGSFNMTKRLIICWFLLATSSLTYNVTSLNTENMQMDRYLFMALSAAVDFPANFAVIVLLRFMGRRSSTVITYLIAGAALMLMLVVPGGDAIGVLIFALIGRFGINANYAVIFLYFAELFSTEVRNSALGSCSTWGHVGSISAPYLVDFLGLINRFIPTTVCGVFVLISAALTFLLPETKTEKLDDGEEET